MVAFFQTPIRHVSSVGPHTLACLTRLGIETVRDLLWHNPLGVTSYPLTSLAQARVDTHATVLVEIVEGTLSRNMSRLVAHEKMRAPHGIQILFFKGGLKPFQKMFTPKTRWFFAGKISLFDGYLSMIHPTRWQAAEKGAPPFHDVIYPLTKGLSSCVLQRLIEKILHKIPVLPEWLPASVLTHTHWPEFRAALRALHSAQKANSQALARERLAFDELLAYQVTLLGARLSRQQKRASPLTRPSPLSNVLLHNAGFQLTASQTHVFQEILQDLKRDIPMARLLQGDVGSGKTIVAFLALAQAIDNEQQGVFLAPTEILAHQQAEKLKALLHGTNINVSLLTRTTCQKGRVLADIQSGKTQLVVGTHAVLQENVSFERLGLVVIDEQHRFGVEQRFKLTQKGTAPHLLVMSATPIPRTLEMTLFGDLDVSTLSEKPAGRGAIETRVIAARHMDELETFVAQHLSSGAQAYWVCPLIDQEKEKEDVQSRLPSVVKRFEHLALRFPGIVGMVHGQQKAQEKQQVLNDFRAKKLQLLVATTVIEVGVDIPEATLMVIEGAGQFGLAQLHQLRGRVGRGFEKSFCFLVYDYPISDVGKQRLEVLKKSGDGFWIAEQDWRLRGGGDLLGIRQSGLPQFSFANLELHLPLLTQAHQLAQDILSRDPYLQSEEGYTFRVLLKLFGRAPKEQLLKIA